MFGNPVGEEGGGGVRSLCFIKKNHILKNKKIG